MIWKKSQNGSLLNYNTSDNYYKDGFAEDDLGYFKDYCDWCQSYGRVKWRQEYQGCLCDECNGEVINYDNSYFVDDNDEEYLINYEHNINSYKDYGKHWVCKNCKRKLGEHLEGWYCPDQKTATPFTY